MMAQKRDGELIFLCNEKRSEEAFTELCRRYARLVFSTCYREIGDRTLAEDAAQGVFLLLSQKIKSLKSYDTLSGWLYTASRFVSRNLVKQERRRAMLEERAALEVATEKDNGNPLWELIEPHFHDALNRLRPADREAVLLRFVQEQSFTEVGVNLGVSENTARMRVNRAIEKIKNHFSKVGITVSAAILAGLLLEKSSQATPALLLSKLPKLGGVSGSGGVSQSTANLTSQASRQMALSKMAIPIVGVVGVLFIAGGTALYKNAQPTKMTNNEARVALSQVVGNWSGDLEYDDSGTKQRVQYKVAVAAAFDSNNSKFSFVSSYPGISTKETYTISLNPATESAQITNAGTYPLNASGALYRSRDGSTLFLGTERGRESESRIRFSLKGDKLEKLEEFRLPGASKFSFRNRYTLTKTLR